MNRYLIFGFDNYYPGGGYNDFLGVFVDGSNVETVKQEARRLAKENRCDFVQVADMFTDRIIMEEPT